MYDFDVIIMLKCVNIVSSLFACRFRKYDDYGKELQPLHWLGNILVSLH